MRDERVAENLVASLEQQPISRFVHRILDTGPEFGRRGPTKDGSQKVQRRRVISRPGRRDRQTLPRSARPLPNHTALR